MKDKVLIKNVRFDFLTNGNIGCCHVEVNCETEEDLKEALAFAKKASELMPNDDFAKKSKN